MKERFWTIIEKIRKTGISEKLLNAQNFKEVSQVFDDFEDNNNGIIEAIENWDLEYDVYKDGHMFLSGEKIIYPIEVLMFLFFCPCEGDEIFEKKTDFIDTLNTFDSKVVKAFAKFIVEYSLFELSTSLFYLIKGYME